MFHADGQNRDCPVVFEQSIRASLELIRNLACSLVFTWFFGSFAPGVYFRGFSGRCAEQCTKGMFR